MPTPILLPDEKGRLWLNGETDNSSAFIEEDFQITMGEMIEGIRLIPVTDVSPFNAEFPKIKYTLIDGELRPVVDEAPSGLIPLLMEAGLLQAIDNTWSWRDEA